MGSLRARPRFFADQIVPKVVTTPRESSSRSGVPAAVAFCRRGHGDQGLVEAFARGVGNGGRRRLLV